MKLKALVIILALFLLFNCSSSIGETTFESYYFQIIMPDGWELVESIYNRRTPHIKCLCRHEEGWSESIYLSEPKFGYFPSELTEAIEQAKKVFSYDQDASWEEIEVSGKKTFLIDAPGFGGGDAYITMIDGGNRSASILYVADSGHREKEGLLDVLETLIERPKEDISFYNFGPVNVKFETWKTSEISGKERILLMFKWRNDGYSITTLASNVEVILFQDGVELNESLTIGKKDYDVRLLPGKETNCFIYYDLNEGTKDFTIVLSGKNDSNDEYADRQIEFFER